MSFQGIKDFVPPVECSGEVHLAFSADTKYMKKTKGSEKSIVADPRKMAEIVWAMLSDRQDFDVARMTGKYFPVNFTARSAAS